MNPDINARILCDNPVFGWIFFLTFENFFFFSSLIVSHLSCDQLDLVETEELNNGRVYICMLFAQPVAERHGQVL